MFKFIKMLRFRNRFCMALIKVWERVKRMIYKGSTAVDDVYIGTQPATEIYKGDKLVHSRLKFVGAGMSYVPGRYENGVIVDGNYMRSAAKCLTLIRSDGAAKAIVFELSTENNLIVPTDEQIKSAPWCCIGYSSQYGTVTGPYPDTYNSGAYVNGFYEPAYAWMYGTRCTYNVPYMNSIRTIDSSYLGISSNAISSDYQVTCVNGVVKIYYQGNLVKTIRSAK